MNEDRNLYTNDRTALFGVIDNWFINRAYDAFDSSAKAVSLEIQEPTDPDEITTMVAEKAREYFESDINDTVSLVKHLAERCYESVLNNAKRINREVFLMDAISKRIKDGTEPQHE